VNGTLTATTFAGSGASLTSIPESAVTNLTTDLAAKAPLSMGAAMMDSTRKRPFFYCDFLQSASAAALDPFVGTGPSGGTFSAAKRRTCDGSPPRSVEAQIIHYNQLRVPHRNERQRALTVLGGDEVFEAAFNLTILALSTFRFGFHDATSSSDAVDGVYIEIDSSGVATGKTASNSTRSSTGTTSTLSTGTWYRSKIVVAAAAASVTFYLYDDSGTQLWTNSLPTNIPTTSGRETSAAVICTNSGTSAIDLMHIDYMAFSYGSDRTR
jgi:hypothetical protein